MMNKAFLLFGVVFIAATSSWAGSDSANSNASEIPLTIEEQEALEERLDQLRLQAEESKKNLLEHEEVLKYHDNNLENIRRFLIEHNLMPPSAQQAI